MKIEVDNINDKIVEQLNVVLEELKKAHHFSYNSPNMARSNISKAEGIIETLKVIIK